MKECEIEAIRSEGQKMVDGPIIRTGNFGRLLIKAADENERLRAIVGIMPDWIADGTSEANQTTGL